FLDRCRTVGTSLVLLLDDNLSELPVEACSVFEGLPALSRDFSLHLLNHRCSSTIRAGMF
ncbi:unnamed protein product, partial [Choristocarpus tenellus]